KDTYDAGKDLYDEHFGTKKTTNLTNTEVINGLKEALEVGTNNSASKASQANGFLYNSKIKIPWPEDAEKAKNTLINIGMKTQVDKVVKTMNRAAEEASKEAAPIFVDAIKQMSIGDGFKILKGANNEATKYLSDKTSAPLKAKFRPIVKEAIKKVKLTQYWNPCVNAYNKIPGVEKMNPDLDDYITQKAMDGLFKLIAEEELKIRKDPIARVSDLLKKVFGSLDK
ncbi:DUF4197 domain-containing protein, partial [Bacteroidales bacterium AH-315-I05]|nr:DUF4197 domain-containing protein [Bacteroidales bacterium AH-315-I05]